MYMHSITILFGLQEFDLQEVSMIWEPFPATEIPRVNQSSSPSLELICGVVCFLPRLQHACQRQELHTVLNIRSLDYIYIGSKRSGNLPVLHHKLYAVSTDGVFSPVIAHALNGTFHTFY